MKRDPIQFPNDDNGEVLWRLVEHGDDLSIARDIDFSLDFATEQQALDCGAYLFKNEFKIELDPPLEGEPDSPWTVQVIPFLAPIHEDISGLEAHLTEIARHFGGERSDWGCEQAVVPERN